VSVPGDPTAEPEDATTAPAGAATARLVRSSAVVGIGTGLSRLSGLLRVGALTFALGATALSDAYNLANTTPNIIYELLLGGVLSASLVPVFVEHDQLGDEDATNAVLTVTVIALAVLTVVAVLAAPLIVEVYTLRLSPAEAAAQTEVAVPLLRLLLPQILFYGLMTLGTALLNARRSFFAPAYAPVLNNVVVISVLLAFASMAGSDASLGEVADDPSLLLLLGLGTTAGIVAMTVALWPAIRHAGIRIRFNPAWRHPAIRTVARLSGWTIGYAVANQIALFVVLALANGEGAGAVSAYTYAFIFFQLPHGLFAVSIMTTFMPDLAGFAGQGDLPGFRDRFGLGMRLLTLVVLPAAVGYIVLARPLVAMLLQRGAFGGASSALTADVLVAFSIGLLGFSVYLLALRGFYAFKDTRTPFFLNLAENGVNIVAALILVGALGVQGLALAYALAYSVGAVLALAALRRRVQGLGGRRTADGIGRMVVASGIMAAAVWSVTQVVGSDDGMGAVVRTLTGVLVGTVVYVLALVALRVPDAVDLLHRVRRRRRPPAAASP
jgi:putative peptidoglycan lipid II flippase